ncbi:MAG: hypothetical protein ABIB98_02850 [bacterium]
MNLGIREGITLQDVDELAKNVVRELAEARQRVESLENYRIDLLTLAKILHRWSVEGIPSLEETSLEKTSQEKEETLHPSKVIDAEKGLRPTTRLVVEVLTQPCDNTRPRTKDTIVGAIEKLVATQEKPALKRAPSIYNVERVLQSLIRNLSKANARKYLPNDLLKIVDCCYGGPENNSLGRFVTDLKMLQNGGKLGARPEVEPKDHLALAESQITEEEWRG